MKVIDEIKNLLLFVLEDVEEFFFLELEEMVVSVMRCIRNVFWFVLCII